MEENNKSLHILRRKRDKNNAGIYLLNVCPKFSFCMFE